MTPLYIDSHAHLTADGVFEQLDELLERARQAGIGHIINICTDPLTLDRGLALSKRFPWIHQVAATTPHDVEKEGEASFALIAECARKGLLKAIGETGLDYHYTHSARPIQKQFLERYLHLALECRLPLVIHCREAFEDFFEILDRVYRTDPSHLPGVLHCFTGNCREAEELIKRGWLLSLSGIVTFKKSVELQEVARQVPLSHLLIETDTPYLAPQRYRGQRNEPAFIVETARTIATLKQLTAEEIAQATSQNARQLFSI